MCVGDLVRGQLDGASGRGHGFVDVVGAHEQLRELRPQARPSRDRA